MWKVRDGYDSALKAGPEWSYPCAVEADRKLYIVYTSEKHHCVLTVIPLESLAGLSDVGVSAPARSPFNRRLPHEPVQCLESAGQQ
jgi:hypothetical protein